MVTSSQLPAPHSKEYNCNFIPNSLGEGKRGPGESRSAGNCNALGDNRTSLWNYTDSFTERLPVTETQPPGLLIRGKRREKRQGGWQKSAQVDPGNVVKNEKNQAETGSGMLLRAGFGGHICPGPALLPILWKCLVYHPRRRSWTLCLELRGSGAD